MGNPDRSKKERRKYPRVLAPVFYRTPRLAAPKRQVSDLSLGGVRIFSDDPLEVGEQLALEFFLPDGSTVKALTKVTWIKEMPENAEAVFDVGMEFVELSEDDTDKLKKVLK